MKFLLDRVVTKENLEITVPYTDAKRRKVASMLLAFFAIILSLTGFGSVLLIRTGIVGIPVKYILGKVAGEGSVIFLLLPFVSLYLFLGFFFLLYRIWSKKVLTRKLGELISLAERAIASLKAAGRNDLEEDIEDAECLIEDYKKRFGF